MLKDRLYKFDYGTLKCYGGKKYKLTHFKCLRTAGLEVEKEYVQKGSVNTDKLENNISRAKAKVYEYALCNKWDFFCTFTLDKTKYDRFNLEQFHKDFRFWISNYNKKYSTNIKYLCIPEKHQDGAWHEHGFIMGLPEEHLTLFNLKQRLPKYIREKLKNGENVYNWIDYMKKFGFCDLEPIRNQEAAAKYVTKYISKNLDKSVKDINAHLYYCSKGLETAITKKKGSMQKSIEPDYKNDYVSVQWFDAATSIHELEQYIYSNNDILAD